MPRRTVVAGFFIALTCSPVPAEDAARGWRGNGTGLWPEATPPLTWHRIPRGALDGLRARAEPPSGDAPGDAPQVNKGLVRDWLVIGPFPVADAVRDLDRPHLADESAARPTAGEKVGTLAWKAAAVPADDPKKPLGDVDLHWLDFLPAVGPYKTNQVAYAHTYLHSPRGGTVRAVVDHACGLKVWVNGQEVYRRPERAAVLGNYAAISRHVLSYSHAASPHFQVTLKPGWNRLLVMAASDPRPGWSDMKLTLRLADAAGVAWDTKNIVWMTELPARSNSTPTRVGDRLFVLSEPDELICLDRATGKVVWSAFNNYYEALTPAERQSNPAFAERVDPLIAALRTEKDITGRLDLRSKIRQALTAIDAARFEPKLDGHFEAHFGIVGFTSTSPISDGRHVWAWFGSGVAACYDLDGKRQWITRLPSELLLYSSYPALNDGTLAVFHGHVIGLDARTGQVRWHQRRITKNNGALLAATFAGTPVIVTQAGTVLRAKDGHILYRARGQATGDTGWCPPLIVGQRMYLPNYGVSHMSVADFTGVVGDDWKPKVVASISLPDDIHRGKNGEWIDRFTAGSPVIVDGLAYVLDTYGTLYVMDLEARKMLYLQEMGLDGLFHYNALGVAASLTLVGKHILALDNQGTTVVFEPGRTYKEIARNRIATELQRWWPVPAQETLSHAPPVADGGRLYLRGERYLYCIGER
jgi:hypothetical protein